MKEKYKMKYTCPNCHREFIQSFDKGEIANQGECPECGLNPEDIEIRRNLPKY